KYSKSDEGQVYTWASGTYDGKNRHRIHLSNFLNTDSHYYLKNTVKTSVSWTDFKPQLAPKLPLPEKTIRKDSPYEVVTYLNYCTFGYTTTYWDWERWEKEIDLMALNGVTHPLAMVGVEAVWRQFLLRIGYTDKEIKEFLPGPAYMPWLLMGNMENLGGPMPDEWFERQIELQEKIVERMREYGMTPVFQAFFGMVPTSFKTKFPTTQIVPQGKWNDFIRPEILSPLDPEFPRLAAIWYEEYEKLFGKTTHYAGDLFHEGGLTGGLNVSECARSVEKCLTNYNPKAVWVVQSWGQNPTPELMNGLSPEHSIIIELCAEFWHRWKDDRGYQNLPWVWSNISNWGGNIGLHGRLDAIATQPIEAQHDPQAGKSLKGIGFTPEGIETNPVVMDLWSDMVWNKQIPDMNTWIKNYSQYRYGSTLTSLQTAWEGFYKTAYGTYDTHRRPSEPVFCAKPSLKVKTVSSWSQSKIFYNPDEFAAACKIFLQDADQLKDNTNYRYDAVDMVRQYISDLGRETYKDLVDAWNKRDRATFTTECKRYLQLIADQDELLLSHPSFCLKQWLDGAYNSSDKPGIQDQYEFYNRLIITSWNLEESTLDDYAHREWGGLLGTYYYKRWEMYFNYLNQAWDNPDLPQPKLFAITETWWYQNISKKIVPSEKDPVDTAVSMFNKYNNNKN
ncbi:MAG: alpha-N-acetylglucosaminidase, partial [Tannerella sp.]|nr:alpha-N-acetylglucosaminidase [Tannerella sp.]